MKQSDLDKWGLRGKDEGDKLKETGRWGPPNFDSTNSSGFNALPCGLRMPTGQFLTYRYLGFFWSSTEIDNEVAIYRMLDRDTSAVYRGSDYKSYGFSIRCVKD